VGRCNLNTQILRAAFSARKTIRHVFLSAKNRVFRLSSEGNSSVPGKLCRNLIFTSVNTFIVPLVTVYYLTKYPEYQTTLYDELFPLFSLNNFDMSRSLSFLDACIYEAMRLQAVVPNGGERNTPPGGLQIGKYWIPGGVVVRVPMYTISRGRCS
jgi:hypothetical protein